MILESKRVPFSTIDITDPGSEEAKDYMNANARPKGNNKVPMTPQVFNDAEYCGDFDDLDMANECDTLGEFLKLTEEERGKLKIGITSLTGEKPAEPATNGLPAEAPAPEPAAAPEEPAQPAEEEVPVEAAPAEEEPSEEPAAEEPAEEAVEESPAEANGAKVMEESSESKMDAEEAAPVEVEAEE